MFVEETLRAGEILKRSNSECISALQFDWIMSITVPNIRTKCGFWNNNTIALLLKSQLKHQTENMSKILNHLTERVVLMQTETSRVAGIPILDRFPWSCIQNTVEGSHPKGPKGPKSREHCREHFRGRSVSSYLYPTPSLYFWNRRQRKGRERGAGGGGLARTYFYPEWWVVRLVCKFWSRWNFSKASHLQSWTM